MSEAELSSTQQSGTLETDAAVLTPDEAQPAAADQETGTTQPLLKPPVMAASSPGRAIETGEKRSVSGKKLAANRINARRSTGPKTAEGKAKSAQNAIKHGIFAKRFLQGASAETVAEMETLIGEMRDYYQPAGKLEEMLVEKIVIENARYARILGVEQEELARKNAFFGPAVDRVARYATSTNRALSRAIEDLERAQAARKVRERAAATTSAEKNQLASAVVDAVVPKSGA
ncbi:MAG TPA: hypothetical protein VMI32_11405 [Candidatus Solibacter sp.]|nr:hypothetical protein [Candidatus Solibacter sp.]